jgi:ribonuclease BN (tRNA processing enzyme)
MPTDARETTCIYVREGEHVLVVDAGTGLRRLVTQPDLLEGARALSVVLTHFHIDHLMGLPFLYDLDHVPEREIWAAGLALESRPADELVHRLVDPPFMPGWGLPGDVRELAPEAVEIGPFSLDVRIQRRHANPTLALKVNGELVVCTDTEYDEENVAFARGARVLCHDAFYVTGEAPNHTGAEDAARLAAEAGVERLVLIHLNPNVDEEALLRASRPIFRATEVGRDGMNL